MRDELIRWRKFTQVLKRLVENDARFVATPTEDGTLYKFDPSTHTLKSVRFYRRKSRTQPEPPKPEQPQPPRSTSDDPGEHR